MVVGVGVVGMGCGWWGWGKGGKRGRPLCLGERASSSSLFILFWSCAPDHATPHHHYPPIPTAPQPHGHTPLVAHGARKGAGRAAHGVGRLLSPPTHPSHPPMYNFCSFPCASQGPPSFPPTPLPSHATHSLPCPASKRMPCRWAGRASLCCPPCPSLHPPTHPPTHPPPRRL